MVSDAFFETLVVSSLFSELIIQDFLTFNRCENYIFYVLVSIMRFEPLTCL